MRAPAAIVAVVGALFAPDMAVEAAPHTDAMSFTQTFVLTSGRAANGAATSARVQVRYTSPGRPMASLTWSDESSGGNRVCRIDGGRYVRGSIRADRGGALSLRLIDTGESATDVLVEDGRLLLMQRARVVAAYDLPNGATWNTKCTMSPAVIR